MKVVFSFDQARCTGCQACVLACTIENHLPFDLSWRTVYTFNERHHPELPVSHLSLSCNHCDDPACLLACPARAYSKEVETGFVVFDETKCIGCRYCMWVCPYGAPRFVQTQGVVGKCTFCNERQAVGQKPACVAYCPTGALGLVGEHTQEQEDIAGFPVTELGPAITIIPATRKRPTPQCSVAPLSRPLELDPKPKNLASVLRHEWPLVAFTSLIPVLVGMVASSFFTDGGPSPIQFLGVAALTAILSSAHLGSKARAWRAVMNPATSWLSREILFFMVLVGAGVVYLAFAPDSAVAGSLALAAGFSVLFSIDRVYGAVPLNDRIGYHSASSMLTGLFFIGVLSANPLVAGFIGAGKLILYLLRKINFRKSNKPMRHELSGLRIGCSFLVPGLLWAGFGAAAHPYLIAAVLIGEMVDRLEFYAELDPVSPARQMMIDLQTAMSDSRLAGTS